MKKLLVTTAGILTLLAVMVLPRSSSAQAYAVSPMISGFTFVSASVADMICRNLPASVAAMVPFCAPTVSSIPTISDVRIEDKEDDRATISWTTNVASTTRLWYAANASTNRLTIYGTSSELSTRHEITVSDIDTDDGRFIVGGASATGQYGFSPLAAF